MSSLKYVDLNIIYLDFMLYNLFILMCAFIICIFIVFLLIHHEGKHLVP